MLTVIVRIHPLSFHVRQAPRQSTLHVSASTLLSSTPTIAIQYAMLACVCIRHQSENKVYASVVVVHIPNAEV